MTQAASPRTSQFIPEINSRLHVTSVSKQFPALSLQHLPCSGDSLSCSSTPPSVSAVDSALEIERTEGATAVYLSTSVTSRKYTDTGFGSEMSWKENTKTDAASLLQDVVSKITFSLVSFGRTPEQILANSDALHTGYVSESYPAPIDDSTSLEHVENVRSGDTGKGKISQKEATSDRLSGTERSDTAGCIDGTTGQSVYKVPTHESQATPTTLTDTSIPQYSSPTIGPTSATKPSIHEQQETAVYGSNLSAWISKQGMVTILSSVVGGSIAFIGIFVLHYLILRHLWKRAWRSTYIVRPEAEESPLKRDKRLAQRAEISHFSIDT